jgi:hypothetical protein
MTTKSKYILGGGTLAIIAIAVYFYMTEKKKFLDYGDSNFLNATHKGNLAFRMKRSWHGVSVGDTVQIDHQSSRVYKGAANVIEVIKEDYHGDPWVIVNKQPPGDGASVEGTITVQ